MADTINATDLPLETANTLDGTEKVIGFDTTQGKAITVDQLAEYILQKKLSTLAGSSQTVAAALTALNSKLQIFQTSEGVERTIQFSRGGYNVAVIIERYNIVTLVYFYGSGLGSSPILGSGHTCRLLDNRTFAFTAQYASRAFVISNSEFSVS